MRPDLARALASGFLAGPWTRSGLVDSGASVLGRRRQWLAPLARQTLDLYRRPPLDRPRELATVIASLPAAARAAGDRPVSHPPASTRMLTNRWGLPALDDLAALARLVDLTIPELGWFADPRRLARGTTETRLQHYRVSHRVAPSGAIRVLEAPKLELKGMQRRLLRDLVSLVPPHPAARGFRPGGSVR